jgi:O-antigen polymerase
MTKLIKIKNESNNFKNFAVTILASIFFFILPFLYETKMESGIEKNDLYLIWISGLVCWVFVNLEKFKLSDYILLFVFLAITASSLRLVNSDINSYKTLITLFFSLGIYFYISQSIFLKSNILIALVPVFVYQFILGWQQVINYRGESLFIQGNFHNSADFANWLAICVIILLGICYNNTTVSKYSIFKLLVWAIIISCLIIICLTGARAAIIGVLAGWISYVFLQKRRRGDVINFKLNTKFNYAIYISLLSVLLILCIYKKDSALGRTTIFKITSQIISEYPFTGVGSNRLQFHYNLFQAKYFMSQERPLNIQLIATNTFESFNFILQIMAEYGLIGISLICSFFWGLHKEIKKIEFTKKSIINRNVIIAALVCILSSAFFSNPFHVTPIFILFIVLLSCLRVNVEYIYIPKINLKYILGKSIFVTISVVLCVWGFRQYKAEAAWKKASILARFNSFKQAKGLYEKANEDLKFDGRFLYNYGAESSKAGYYDESLLILNKAKDYNSFSHLYLYIGINYLSKKDYRSAETALLKSLNIIPSSLITKYYLIQIYIITGQKNKARRWLNYTKNYPVKINNETSNLIMTELNNLKIK